MARHGEKKIDSWRFTKEGGEFAVDVYMLRNAVAERADRHVDSKVQFRIKCPSLEISEKGEDLNALRKLAAGLVSQRASMNWQKKIYIRVHGRMELWKSKEKSGDRNHTFDVTVDMELLEICEVGPGKFKRRRQDSYSSGAAMDGLPEIGVIKDGHWDSDDRSIGAIIDDTQENRDALDTIGTGFEAPAPNTSSRTRRTSAYCSK